MGSGLEMIRLIIASDNRLYREALVSLLSERKFIDVVGASENAVLTIDQTYNCEPDVVLIDMTMLDSNQVIEEIAPSHLKTKVIVLAMTEDEDNILHCAKRGVAGYLTRNATFDHLVSAISGVVEGKLFCPRKIAESLFIKINSIHTTKFDVNQTVKTDKDSTKNLLTQREKEIVLLLKTGKSNKEIARDLNIETSTVKNHIHNILSKIGARNRIQAVNQMQKHSSFE